MNESSDEILADVELPDVNAADLALAREDLHAALQEALASLPDEDHDEAVLGQGENLWSEVLEA